MKTIRLDTSWFVSGPEGNREVTLRDRLSETGWDGWRMIKRDETDDAEDDDDDDDDHDDDSSDKNQDVIFQRGRNSDAPYTKRIKFEDENDDDASTSQTVGVGDERREAETADGKGNLTEFFPEDSQLPVDDERTVGEGNLADYFPGDSQLPVESSDEQDISDQDTVVYGDEELEQQLDDWLFSKMLKNQSIIRKRTGSKIRRNTRAWSLIAELRLEEDAEDERPERKEEEEGVRAPVESYANKVRVGDDDDNDDEKSRGDLLRELTDLKDEMSCKVCMDRDSNVLLTPCNHLVCCDSCSVRLASCPICRTKVGEVVKVYHS
ncbi:E3 ubiquitin-protein ligase RNF34-like [Anneissia japonica]|uniref:E3 ubiquitin-protein ligase RNF34-like n=1 Tax=Anneissia japonica TaxID=1529436 RepID=UPI001425677F|nr:E3 ubiquitin-protein ligase RNF34-like [Anneissia japonica]